MFGVGSRHVAMATVVGSVAVLAGCGGSGGVSASSYMASACKSLGTWESTVKSQEQRTETELPSVLAQAANGGSAVLTRAKTLLVTFTTDLVTATKTVQKGLDAAGTPNVKNGSQITAKLHDAFGSALSILETDLSHVEKISTSSASAFESEATTLERSIQSAFGSFQGAAPNSPELNAAGKKVPACVALGFT